MAVIGSVETLWRYPVKGMRGQQVDELFLGYAGVYGDRLYAFVSSANRPGFPWFTGRDDREMIRYRPRFRNSLAAARPSNLADAEKAGANPLAGSVAELMIDVETPDGGVLAIDDPELVRRLCARTDGKHNLSLRRCDKPMTDARPLSIISMQTIKKLSEEAGMAVDSQRFRANVYVDLTGSDGFAEDDLVGKSVRIGEQAVASVLQRDSRCSITTLDPDTAEKSPEVLKAIGKLHEGKAGVYAAVLREGIIRKGDTVELL